MEARRRRYPFPRELNYDDAELHRGWWFERVNIALDSADSKGLEHAYDELGKIEETLQKEIEESRTKGDDKALLAYRVAFRYLQKAKEAVFAQFEQTDDAL